MSTQGKKRTAAAIGVDGWRNKAAKRKQITVQAASEEQVRGATAGRPSQVPRREALREDTLKCRAIVNDAEVLKIRRCCCNISTANSFEPAHTSCWYIIDDALTLK